MKTLALVSMMLAGKAFCYEVVIVDNPSTETISEQQLVEAKPINDKTTLIEFLGGVHKIKKIVLGINANRKSDILSEAVVSKRFASFVCVDSRKDEWMFAPFAVGTIYLVDNRKQSFAMGVTRSGIQVAGHLFGPPNKPQAEQAVAPNGP